MPDVETHEAETRHISGKLKRSLRRALTDGAEEMIAILEYILNLELPESPGPGPPIDPPGKPDEPGQPRTGKPTKPRR